MVAPIKILIKYHHLHLLVLLTLQLIDYWNRMWYVKSCILLPHRTFVYVMCQI